MNDKFFDKQKHDVNYRRLYDDKTQSQRKHIIKFIIFFDVIFIL